MMEQKRYRSTQHAMKVIEMHAQGMNNQSRQQHTPYPAMRVYLCGEFTIERLIPALSAEQPPTYQPVPREAWSHRGPALTLLKVLLCAPGRRAAKDALCRLMQLLAEQERSEEALLLYAHTKRALHEDGMQPSPRTTDLVTRLHQGVRSPRTAPRSSDAPLAAPEHVVSETPNQEGAPGLFKNAAQADAPLGEQMEHAPFPGISQSLFASTVLQPMLQAYEDVLVLAWEAFYTSSVQRVASTVDHWLLHLAQQITTVPTLAHHLAALRCRFLQLKSVIARDHTDFPTALATINEAITLAFHLESAELVASSLYRRAKSRAAQQRYELAVQDLESVLPYAQRSRDPLRCYIAMFLAEVYSLLAPGDAHFTAKSLALLDEVERAVRTYGVLEGDGSFVKVDVPGLFMIRGDVLRRAGQLTEAGEALQLVRSSLPKEFLRWHGNLCIAEAHVALAGQDMEQSCQVTEEALDIFQATQSRSGLAKVQRLYASLQHAQPAHPRVRELGAHLDAEQHEPIARRGDR